MQKKLQRKNVSKSRSATVIIIKIILQNVSPKRTMKCPLKKGFRIQFDIGCFPGEKRAGAGKLRRELPAGSPGRRGEVSDGQRPGLRS